MMNNFVRLLHHAPWAALVLLAFISFFALPWSLELSPTGVMACGIVVTLLALLLARFRPSVRGVSAVHPHALLMVVAGGIAVRVAYVLLVPPVQLSDMAEYLALARNLLAGEGFQQELAGHQVFAYRAPGYPFLLAGTLWLTGDTWWGPAALNLVCYAAAAAVLNDLTTRLAGRTAALLCAVLFACWPSGIMSTGLAITEPASLLFLLVVAWSTVRSRASGTLAWALLTGLALGIGALTRPSLLPLPVLLLALALIDGSERRHSLRHALVSLLVAVACIAPWTVRNFVKLGSPVAVSTNGGDNLYRANNPLASGGFSPTGEKSFLHLLPDEVAWNRAASSAARQWIVEHPLAFLRLAARKAAIFLGDDATGAYWSMHRAHGANGRAYGVATAASNAWWVGIWMLMLAVLLRSRASLIQDHRCALLMWLAVGLPFVHVVFEAQPRYHMPIVGLLLCLAAVGLHAPQNFRKSFEPGEIA